MKLFPSTYVRSIDNYTIENEPVDSIDLMERAAKKWTERFIKYYSNAKNIFVFAGPGNNGGDALAISRMLIERQYNVNCFILTPSGKMSDDCSINFKRLEELKPDCLHMLKSKKDFPDIPIDNIVIDGLFGSGLSRKTEGIFRELIGYINSSGAEIVSVDIPSGLFGETNEQNDFDGIIKASRTFTFQFPFLSYFFAGNDHCIGEWEILDIGLSQVAIENTDTDYYMLERAMICDTMNKRRRFDHKGSFGHALIIAGSRGMTGAAILAGKASLRGGAGLVTVHIPSDGYMSMQTSVPEIIVSVDRNSSHFTELPDISKYSSVGIGPGLGNSDESIAALKELLEKINIPLLIDADGLNHIARNKDLLRMLPRNTILTPHPGEFDRLFGPSNSAWKRHEKQLKFSKDLDIIIILKGAFTGISLPDGRYFFNPTGNPGMATGGSGDVLTGLIVSLLARGLSPEDASKAGVFMHGLAGDMASKKWGQDAMIAGDIIEYFGDSFKLISSQPFLHEERKGGIIQ